MTNKEYIKLTIEQAKHSVEEGGFPAGAVLVLDDKIVAKGTSIGFKLNDPTGHAETSAIRQACADLKTSDLSGAVMYSSMQPCMMCFSVANWAGISKIVYGCNKTDEMAKKGYYEGLNNIEEINNKNNRKIILEYVSDFEDKILELINDWENKTIK